MIINNMNDFIKTQQELARDTLIQSDASGFATLSDSEVDEIITQIIQNTGEELMRRAEEGERWHSTDGGESGMISEIDGHYIDLNTLKQHITQLTGVE